MLKEIGSNLFKTAYVNSGDTVLVKKILPTYHHEVLTQLSCAIINRGPMDLSGPRENEQQQQAKEFENIPSECLVEARK
jgi:hypothetical protein